MTTCSSASGNQALAKAAMAGLMACVAGPSQACWGSGPGYFIDHQIYADQEFRRKFGDDAHVSLVRLKGLTRFSSQKNEKTGERDDVSFLQVDGTIRGPFVKPGIYVARYVKSLCGSDGPRTSGHEQFSTGSVASDGSFKLELFSAGAMGRF